MRLIISMPVRNDWQAASLLCSRIDLVLRQTPEFRASVLLIDDGSTRCANQQDIPSDLQALESISVLELRRNLGHQRAIAVGLAHLQHSRQGDGVVFMDADGEDRPEDILTLLRAAQNTEGRTAVFAERGKRLETPVFRAFYEAYRVAHHILTGRDIRFGNFSYVPWPFLETLTVFPELWNHYAATFIKSSLPYLRIRVDRAKRLTGRSQMKFVDLVVHGLSALFANQEVVGTRVLIMIFLSWLLLVLLIAAGTIVKLFTSLAIPGWAGVVAALLIVLASQAIIAAFVLFFSITMNRSQLGFLPIRDYAYFIRRETRLFER
jgi:glycosyltransferase involved in cell wall biosynthesis